MSKLIDYINLFPNGVSPKEIERDLGYTRSTLSRHLKPYLELNTIVKIGNGPSTKYRSKDRHIAIKSYFNKPHTERKLAPYDEKLLSSTPGLSKKILSQFDHMPKYSLDKREMTKFLIDFSCASSILEGGTYSLLDTQALIDYGEKSIDKPTEDAILVLNHKQAFEFLYNNMSYDSVYKVHDLLTNDHQLEELKNSRYFLTQEYRGKVRKHNDIDIALSSYLPPFRPGTDYLQEMLEHIFHIAQSIESPVQASFYLLTRIAYLQPFQDGNKRTSRAMCNIPLINANLPPISFVDFAKKEYIISMLAFYELGDISLAESCFIEAYKKSIKRLK